MDPHELRSPQLLQRSGCFVTSFDPEYLPLEVYDGDKCGVFRHATQLNYLTILDFTSSEYIERHENEM